MDYLEDKGLVNPIYNENVTRTGCFWCPKQRKSSLYNLYTNYPKQWEKMKEMEERAGKTIRYGQSILEVEKEFEEKAR